MLIIEFQVNCIKCIIIAITVFALSLMSVGDYFKGLPRWHWTRSLLTRGQLMCGFHCDDRHLATRQLGELFTRNEGVVDVVHCCYPVQLRHVATTEQVGTSSALLTLGSLSGDQYTQFSGSGEVLVQSTRFAVGAHVNARRRIWREIRITT